MAYLDFINIEDLWLLFKSKIQEGIDKFVPFKKIKSKESCPWVRGRSGVFNLKFTICRRRKRRRGQLHRKIKQHDKAYKQRKQTGRERDERKFQKLKHEVQRDLRRSYRQYVEELITPDDAQTTNSMKRFYKFIKHKKMDHHGVSSLKVDGKLITDPKMKAEALNKQFKSVFVNETDFVSQPSVPRFPSMPQIIFPSSTVLKLLQDLNPAKASGPDNLSPRVLKEISSQIAVPLAVVSKNL